MAPTVRRIAALLSFTATALLCVPAHAASAPDAGDFVALPPGTNLTLLYAQQTRANAVYDGQRKVADDLGLRLDTGIARYVRYEEVAGHIVDWELILPTERSLTALATFASMDAVLAHLDTRPPITDDHGGLRIALPSELVDAAPQETSL